MDLIWIVVSSARWTNPSKVERLGSFYKIFWARACSFCKISMWGVRDACIIINLALMLAFSIVNTAILLYVYNKVWKCCCVCVESWVSFSLDNLSSSSSCTICWPTSSMNGAMLHNFVYKDRILPNTSVTWSIFLANSTYDMEILVVIFSFTLL